MRKIRQRLNTDHYDRSVKSQKGERSFLNFSRGFYFLGRGLFYFTLALPYLTDFFIR